MISKRQEKVWTTLPKKSELEEATVFLEEADSPITWEDTKKVLQNAENLEHVDLVHAWAMAAKMIKQNSQRMQSHREAILKNAKSIGELEAAIKAK